MIFEDMAPDVGEKYLTLVNALDGTQPCLGDPEGLYMENWTSRPIPEETAQKLCGGCKFTEECGAYAIAAGEEDGIWGGTTPQGRKALRIIQTGAG